MGTTGRSRGELLARYRALVLHGLPARARAERWVVTADHCVGRIVLDNTVGGCWYDALGPPGGHRPAFERLDDGQLAAAVGLAERIEAEGDPLLRVLDARSLAWRGKPARRPAAQP